MNFAALRALPVGNVRYNIRVQAIKDLTWSDGQETHTHARAGDQGNIIGRTEVGFLVRFDRSGETRQVFDFQGTAPPKTYRAEDEIALA